MADNERAEFEEWKRKRESMEAFPKLPSGVDDDTADEFQALQYLYSQTAGITSIPQEVVERALGRKVPAIKTPEDVFRAAKKFVAKVNPEPERVTFPPDPRHPLPKDSVRQYTDARGRVTVDRTDETGAIVERQQMSREDQKAAEDRIKTRVDEAASIRDAGHDVAQLGEIIARERDPTVAAPFIERRDALQETIRTRKATLTNDIVEDLRAQGLSEPQIAHAVRETWGGRDGWGLSYEAREPGVNEALELARDGRIGELYDALPRSPQARMQLWKFLDEDPALRDVREQLLEEESGRRNEVQEQMRIGGVLG